MKETLLEKTVFESLINTEQQITEEDIINWLENSNEVDVIPDQSVLPETLPIYSEVITVTKPINNIKVLNFLDPASAGVIIAGLAAVLAWISTERRHKETLANNNPPPVNNTHDKLKEPDLCKKIENEKACALPLLEAMEIKGPNFMIIFRKCTNTPKPHTTVDYYQQW